MMITDLRAAKPEDIDLDLLERKLWNLRRFQGHPKALVVRQHTHLVRALAIRGNASGEAIEWAFHHDDHEAIIGDLHGLLVRMIDAETDVLSSLSDHLDRVICDARGIDWPSKGTRREVHVYDKLAESIETRIGFGWPVLEQHPEWPAWLTHDLATRLYHNHRSLTAPLP